MAEEMTTQTPPEAAPLVHGRPAAWAAALEAAADVLLRARLPLVYGLVQSTVEAQREAVGLADLLGAALDPASSATHGPAILALQQHGRVSATLGEVRNRADLIVYWGVDPDAIQPGFRDRYTRPAPGAPARRSVAVDLGADRGPDGLEERFAIAPEREYEALVALRALVRGRRVEDTRAESLGAPLERLRALAALLTGCRYGVIFHEGDPAPGRAHVLHSAALLLLAAEASARTRVRLIGIRMPGNAVGAEKVLTWQAGYPFGVHFGRGYPRYGPDEFTGEALLSRGEADAALLIGVEPSRHLSARALEHLGRVPSVAVGAPAPRAAVVFPTAAYPETPGSFYRMDGVGLRRRLPPTARPSEARVLAELSDTVRRRKLGGGA